MDPKLEHSDESELSPASSVFYKPLSRAGFAEPRRSTDGHSIVDRYSTHGLRPEPFDNLSFESQTQNVPQSNTRQSAETPEKALKREPLQSKRDFYRVAKEWWLEIISCAGSLLALTAIVTFLTQYDGHIQPKWPYNITPNSVISWFATLMKALMLVPIAACISQASWIHFHSESHVLKDLVTFDNASRGPMGSLQLLGKFWQRILASLGALITILTLGVNPIIQQLIIIKTRPVDLAALASLGRAQSLLRYDTLPWFTGPRTFPMLDTIGAMLEGILSKPESSDAASLEMTASCPTGSCTFPPFQSLAVGSICQDVTYTINHTCGSDGLYCEYRLPNGLKVNKTLFDSLSGSIASTGDLDPIGTMEYGNSFFNFSIITTDGLEESLEKGATAMQCFLYWCVSTYNSSVIDGRLHEDIQDSWHSNITEWVGTATQDVFTVSEGTTGSSENKRLNLVPPSPSDIFPTSTFTVAYHSTNALRMWLTNTLSISNSLVVHKRSSGYTPTFDSSMNSVQIMRRFQSSNNMSTLFANLAKGITRNIRSQNWTAQTFGDGGTDIPPVQGVGSANGTATDLEVYMHVQWGWLAFPAALVCLTMVLLAITMFDTARGHIPVWKSSPLPLLFHGLQGRESGQTRTLKPVNEITGMRRLAKETNLRLTHGDFGSKLLVARPAEGYSFI